MDAEEEEILKKWNSGALEKANTVKYDPPVSLPKRHELIALIAEREATPVMKRVPFHDTVFCRENGCSLVTYKKYRKQIENEPKIVPNGEQSYENYLQFLWENKHKNSKYAELWGKAMGVLKDKSEVKVDLSINPDEFARSNIEAERRLRESQDRVVTVQEKPTALLSELCVDSGQDITGDSEVEELESPVKGSGGSSGVAG